MNEKLVREYHRGNKCAGFGLISISLILLGCNIWLLVEHFKTFWIADCVYNKVNLIISIIIIILLVALVLIKLNQESSVLTVFIITLIFNYMNGTSLSSIPGKCNPLHNKSIDKNNFLYSSWVHIIINTTLASIAITYRSLNKRSSKEVSSAMKTQQNNSDDYQGSDDGDSVDSNDKMVEIDKSEDPFNNQTERQISNAQFNKFIWFHLAMMLYCFYLGNLINFSYDLF
jgi:thiol:disulfide interchange protein